MKKAFTLIELLVVIAIIAILAAILFPVFASAKSAAKKVVGLTQTKQIALGASIYFDEYDGVLFPYQFADDVTKQAINPAYTVLKPGDPRLEMIGPEVRYKIFFSQLLHPYIKDYGVWKAPTNGSAWVNYESGGHYDYRGDGAQNSYGINLYAFIGVSQSALSNGAQKMPMNQSMIAEPSNTLALADGMYFNVLPKMPLSGPCTINGYLPSFPYSEYWKNLGNSKLFGSNGPISDQEAEKLVKARYGGALNVVRIDTSAKSFDWVRIVNDLRNNPTSSIWDPLKLGCQ